MDKKDLLKDLPEKPGIYKFFDLEKTLIYVGKAKNIKKRVSNYFNKLNHLDNKTRRLVSQIESVDYTIVDTEFDAYLLENNLIKAFQPRYNILLKDDKTYPFIFITNERFPKILSTRKLDRSLGTFYGPYTSVKAMNTVIELVRKLFTLRTCNYNLSVQNIEEKKFKICLEYHIGNCKGPCEDLINEDDYNRNISQIHHILKGNISHVKNHFKDLMAIAAENLEFEKAQIFKNRLELLNKFQSGSVIVNPKITDLEVYTILSDNKSAVINFFKIVNGIILQTQSLEIKKKLDEPDEEILSLAVIEIREKLLSETKDIITNISIPLVIDGVTINIPEIGDKKKLISLSLKNNLHHLQKIQGDKELQKQREDRVLKAMQKDLQLKALPRVIECFDNSNIQGTNPVSAMVCFINGKPAKKEYRHYNIKTVIGPNDFDSMYEVVHRRYARLINEAKPLPDLIIIDGGKGQLSAACRALYDLKIYGQIPIIGIAKRLEEIFYPEDQQPLFIDKKSEALMLIQQLRNEAHRFAITFHRKKRSNSSLQSKLTEFKGIGPKMFEKLLIEFKTVKKIEETDEDTLAKIIGLSRAKKLKQQIEEAKKKGE
ncbi:MAG TPA: excinuclease ABC subunit UvrC [Cytophagaceae bacterium]